MLAFQLQLGRACNRTNDKKALAKREGLYPMETAGGLSRSDGLLQLSVAVYLVQVGSGFNLELLILG